MAKNKGNIIMFPRWKENLEEKSIQLLNDQKYEDALETIDLLLKHNALTFKMNMAKLLCHIELDQYNEAIRFAKSLLNRDDPDFAAYLEFYLTISYQMDKFELVMDVFEREKKAGTISDDVLDQLNELYKLSFQMHQQNKHRNSLAYLKELEQLINEGNERGQWELINGLRDNGMSPPREIKQLLTSDKVNPVMKTNIFTWLKESDVKEVVKIKKFGETVSVNPEEVSTITKHPILQKTLYYLMDIEQENPSLYKLIEDLLTRYTYVKYPLIYAEDEANMVAKALIYIGKTNLHLPIESNDIPNEVNAYIEEINKCNELYLNIVDH